MLQQFIQKIYTRPIRQRYYTHDLGPKNFLLDTNKHINRRNSSRMSSNDKIVIQQNSRIKRIKREDRKIVSRNCPQLHLSFYKFETSSNNFQFRDHQQQEKQISLIYLHTHNGSKLEGLGLIQSVLSLGINFCIFDFSGYGNSKGQEVTLGVKQIEDIHSVIYFLEQQYEQVGFFLWGRSMGAVSALRYLGSQLYKNTQSNILGAIYDSPFSSLQKLTYEMLSKSLGITEYLLTPLVYLIKNHLKQKIPFEQLQMQTIMGEVDIPCVFITSKCDTMINCEHSQKLHNLYGGEQKQLVYIQKNHNQLRTNSELSKVYDFIDRIVKKYQFKEDIVMRNYFWLRNKKNP